jgi:hypothetical protein
MNGENARIRKNRKKDNRKPRENIKKIIEI